MLLLFIFLLWSLPLCFINCFRGCVLFSWYLSSRWQWWWLWVKVLWWWWWSLQWWLGKCFSSYLGHHFPKDVVLVLSLTLVVYVFQKTLMGIASVKYRFFFITWVEKTTCENVQYHFFSSPMWSKNHLRVCKCVNIIILFTYLNKKNHLWVCKSAISFFSFMCESKKSIVGSQVCNIIFFLLV